MDRIRNGLGRRSLLGAGLLATLAWPQAEAALAVLSLKQAAARAGLWFGSDSDVQIDRMPPAYAQLFEAQCDLLAPQVSWRSTAPTRTSHEPAWEDPNIGFARAHGMRLTGGHLLWHENLPTWFAELEPAAAQAAVDQHIRQITKYYAGQVFSWNVVNEAIDANHGDADGLRRSLCLEKLGPNFISSAFRAARAADPHALLVYNDYAFEMPTSGESKRRTALLRLLDRIQRDAPIQGVGLQSHLRLDSGRFDADLYGRFLQELASRGLKILITELDVLDANGSADIADRDARVAALYWEFLSAALAQPAVCSVTVWGLSDRYTWLTAARAPHFGRNDGLPTRPLPFDDALRPKPAFYAILDALQKALARAPA